MILLFTIFVLLSKSFKCFSNTGFEIRDLNEDSITNFLPDLSSWSIQAVMGSSLYTKCANMPPILGGPNVLLNNGHSCTRIYSSLAPHDTLYYSLTFVLFDYWDGSDYLTLVGDSVPLNFKDFVSSFTQFPISQCDSSTNRPILALEIIGITPHSSSSFTLTYQSNLNGLSSLKSFGFRDIRLSFGFNDGTKTTRSCVATSITLLNNYNCKCSNGYPDPNGSCEACDPACRSCYGPKSSDCYTCKDGAYFDGANCLFCFVYNNGSCLRTCLPPFQQQKQASDLTLCNLPRCGANLCSTCQQDSDCASFFHCNGGVCQSYITYSLNTEIIKSITNGYIISVEITPLTGLDSNKDDNLLMVLDSLSLGQDYSITIKKISKGVFQITFTILKSLQITTYSAHFTYSPTNLLVQGDLNMPKVVYVSDTLRTIARIVQGGSYASFGILAIVAAICALTGGLSVIWSFLPENQYSYYLLYLNVQYPYQTKVYLRSLANYNVLFTSSSQQPDDTAVIDKVSRNSLPPRFIEENYPVKFYDNIGSILEMMLVIIVTFIIISILLRCFIQPFHSRFGMKVLKTLRKFIKWNGLTRPILAYSLPTMLAVCIQFQVLIFGGQESTTPSFLAIVTLVLFSLSFLKVFFIIKNIPHQKFERIVYTEWYGSLWEDLDTSSAAIYYYWLLALRGILLVYLSVFFYLLPYIQIVGLLISQCLVISLFFKGMKFRKVFESKSLTIVSLIQEILILVTKTTVLVYLAVSASEDSDRINLIFGWLIVLPGISSQILQNIYALVMKFRQRGIIVDKFKRLIRSVCRKKRIIVKIKRPANKVPINKIHVESLNENNTNKFGLTTAI